MIMTACTALEWGRNQIWDWEWVWHQLKLVCDGRIHVDVLGRCIIFN
jgi:hypothetical protein